MGGFLKSFLGALSALIVFSLAGLFILILWLGSLVTSGRISVGTQGVLVLDLSQNFHEQAVLNPLGKWSADDEFDLPGVYDITRLIGRAARDSSIKGIYLKCDDNANGFAASEEIRQALTEFKKSGKFIFAFGDVIPQKAYYVGSVADAIYCNPKGGVDWRGFAGEMAFFKGMLQKLDIEPQIFYAGKFKSATEPLREVKMTDANRLQTSVLLSDLYNRFLAQTASARGLDSGLLRRCVDGHLIRYADDALSYKLVDGLIYDDQLKDKIRQRLNMTKDGNINFIPIAKYRRAVEFRKYGKELIAVIYAEGDIISGKGDFREIGGDTYRALIRQARMDNDIKAIVIRINSGGGSSLVSENLWRELSVARSKKPVVVSFGDVAASGAYYLSCNADSIFAQANTITGSIGVFSILPNLQGFFKNKLGVTFDDVKTAPDADEISVTKPLTATQRQFIQNEVDSIYHDFRSRVAEGRKLTMEFVDSIGQGRVWSGSRAQQLGLVDRLGSLQDAINCAAKMAGTSDYRLREYPEEKDWLGQLFESYRRSSKAQQLQGELGEQGYRLYTGLRSIRSMTGSAQTRLPFVFSIN